jgi:hypothetical protein
LPLCGNVSKVHAIGHECSEFGHIPVRGYRYRALLKHQVDDQFPLQEDEIVAQEEKAIGSCLSDGAG